MQVHTVGKCYLFDILQASASTLAQLKLILEHKSIIKVFHDCRQDAAALFYQKGIKLQTTFDTQVRLSPDMLYCKCINN